MSDSEAHEKVRRPRAEKGTQCCAYGCKKRKKSRLNGRSDSEGSEDEESALKRCQPRTFHSIPNDPERRRAWLVGLHRKKWTPSSHSRVCSDHFKESDMDRTGQTVRVRSDAIPTRLKSLPKHLRMTATKPRKPPLDRSKVITSKAVQERIGLQLENTVPECNRVSPTRRVQLSDHQYYNPECNPSRNVQLVDHEYYIKDSPKRLTGKLHLSNEKIAILRKKLKHAQQKSRRLQMKVKSLKDIVKHLRKKQRQLELGTSHENVSSENSSKSKKKNT
ncbi:THAP domain-containing protein 1-like [Sardina pilchardus]|uniref:THAP domain-containing protein 1-like n=1 Tax=Sardina pilchardus TaxID=27697 RepID=UPI002E10B9ED